MDSHDIERYFQQHRRTLAVLLLIVGMTAVSGVFVGMRQTASQRPGGKLFITTPAEPLDPINTIPAPKYRDISESQWLANADWKFTLEQLPRTGETREASTPLTAPELLDILEARASNRAFDGAPPTIPHDIRSISSKACVVCHSPEADLKIGDKRPAAMSHPYYANCTQCHVPGDGLRQLTANERLRVESAFAGRKTQGQGTRAYPGAPPTLSHPVFMRQNCMSCHGPSRPNAIRTSHPQRRNCLQCHAPDADLDNRERILQTESANNP